MSPRHRAWLLAAAGVLLLAFAARLAWQSGPVHPLERSAEALLPDVGGPIRLAATSLNSARRSALRNAPLMNRIANVLHETIELLVLVDDRDAFTVTRDPWPGRLRFVEVDPERTITVWPQDPFVVLAGEDEPVLLQPARFERGGDDRMAQALANARGWELRRSELLFEGGNLVSDERRIYIGAETIRRNAIERGESDLGIAARFEAELGREIWVVGPLPQPVGHLDLVLTPLGDGAVLLADPEWGADLAEGADPAHVREFERESERQFFGHPWIEALEQPDGKEVRSPEIVGTTASVVDQSRTLASDFAQIARELETRGLRVERIPFLGPKRAAPNDGPGRRGPGYPVLSYNNVLLEERGGSRIVYLPLYGLPELDEAAANVWRELGYTPRPISGLATTAMYGGSLRCAVKVLAR